MEENAYQDEGLQSGQFPMIQRFMLIMGNQIKKGLGKGLRKVFVQNKTI
jgi:hypothetical protein